VGGTVVIIVLLALVVPVAIMMTGLVVSAVLGQVIKTDVDKAHEGSELLELSQRS